MDLLRLITAGSVDDGKSTLIGRLLYDSKNILADQLEAVERSSKKSASGIIGANGAIDLALLTDGLRAEREQGITIDVAYRYFSTEKRKFIIADAPGHIQYTRNMITGASNVNLAIILIDARKGVVEQTRRHSIIASLLRIPRIVVAINKIDLVGYSENVFNDIVIDYNKIAHQLRLTDVNYIPISALNGDNVVEKSTLTPWYEGRPLLQLLEEIEIVNNRNLTDARFQVQYIIRPQVEHLHDYRGYTGKVVSGIYRKGDRVKVLPAGLETQIEKIEIAGVETAEAFAGQSVTFLLKDEIDISRGDSIIKAEDSITATTELEVLLTWLDEKPLRPGNKYLLQHQSKIVKAIVKKIEYKIDVNTLDKITNVEEIKLNEVVKASLKLASGLAVDAYEQLPSNGAAILIDETSNNTVAGVLIQ
jgi:sulfate adenylyltransferase subunit 1